MAAPARMSAQQLRDTVSRSRWSLLRPLTRFREMHFPSFSAEIHDDMTRTADYFRYATLGLAVQRILDEDVEGAFAEVGVWQGQTSEMLHRLAPSRRLLLFDTFSGFPDEDLPPGEEDDRFRDTSAAAVRKRVGPSQNVTLVPGYVPETLQPFAEERFAFALLDLDLSAPTLGALEFFYPRMSAGGYLVVHDYNNPESDWACKRMFDAFLADKPERVFEIGDMWGSALIRRIG